MYQKEIGYLPQKVPYYPDFSVFDFLMYMSAINNISKNIGKKRVEEILKEVGLLERISDKVGSLSGGMKQRLGIAQALITKPSILILDEPTAGLDPKERVRFRNLIHRLSRGITILISTHIVLDIEYIADNIIMMKKGRIILHGDIDNVVKSAEKKFGLA